MAEHSFALLGDEISISLECGSEAERDKWVHSLREVIRYRKELVHRRSELTEEEKKSYY